MLQELKGFVHVLSLDLNIWYHCIKMGSKFIQIFQ